jgi:glycine cleavage system H protein
MKIEKGLYYTKDHEWIRLEGEKAYIGITDYAQEAMGDIVYVELPDLEEVIEAREQCGAIESVKAAADIFMPITSQVIEVNELLEDEPEKLNESPFETYIFVINNFDYLLTTTLESTTPLASFVSIILASGTKVTASAITYTGSDTC